MEFDPQGNLFPYKVLEIDLDRFEEIFVTNFENSETRKLLFQNYLAYIEKLKNEISNTFYQWIDGSFVTMKLNPNDIDVVSFLNHEIYENSLTQLAELQGHKLKKEQHLDCYFVKEYPIEHKNYEIITKYDSVEWFHLFSKTRINRNGKRFSKGIIQINF
ncbi:MAG: hypothetical protein MUF58_19245 [Arcicella sp.]|jgi:hypothetical protein|nr:hypothetical protein [Arcicella sp.]